MTNDSRFPSDDQVPPPNDLRFKFVLSDDQVIYAVKPTGELLWYRYDPDLKIWDSNSGRQIGFEWDQFVHVFSGGDGIIYAIKLTGELLWYQDTFRDGTNGQDDDQGWAENSGNQIGFEWDQFVHVFSGGDGIIDALNPTGELLWYQDTLRDGTNGPDAGQGWAENSGSQIDNGWDEFVHVFSGGDGVIYAITPTGELLWYQDTLQDGTNGANAEQGWDPNSGSQIGFGWDEFVHVFSAGNGIIYGVLIDNFGGNVQWYRDLLRNGTNGPDASQGWDPSSGSVILEARQDENNPGQTRPGWQIIPIEGYCWPLSARS